VQLAPYFGEQRLDRIGRHEIGGFIRAMSRSGRPGRPATAAGTLVPGRLVFAAGLLSIKRRMTGAFRAVYGERRLTTPQRLRTTKVNGVSPK
jgi:hypothetical protein